MHKITYVSPNYRFMKINFTKLFSPCLLIFFISCNPKTTNKLQASLKTEQKPHVTKQDLKIEDYKKLYAFLNASNYNLDSVRKNKEVPFLITENIRSSIKTLETKHKKDIFVQILLPNLLLVNDEILEEREKVKSIFSKDPDDYSAEENNFLDSLSTTYRIKKGNRHEILKHLDILPPSLMLAQAILESGWGGSKFSIYGNSIFGMHTSSTIKGNYIQAHGSSIKLAAYKNIKSGIKDYIKNINRHRAYRKLREVRNESRLAEQSLNSIEMAKTQNSYSELGQEYIKRVSSLIHNLNLKDFDDAKLIRDEQKIFIHIKK